MRRTAVAVVVAAAALLIWLLVRGGGSPTSATSTTASRPSVAVVSEGGLRTLAKTLGGPIYWAGSRPGVTYELTQLPNREIFVRYLPPGTAAGANVRYPFVGTFPFANAYGAISGVAVRPSAVRVPLDGGIAFYDRATPTNIHLAFRGSSYQVEVFDPNPARARALVTSGQIQPIWAAAPGAVSGVGLRAASAAALGSYAASFGHPVYWAGPQPAATYELSQTASGGVFVRYLPHGVPVGTRRPYFFVGTLPVKDAFSATATAAATRADAVRLPVGGSAGVAFYSRSHPSTIYLAYPGSDYQIEIFDPNPPHARLLVTGGRISGLP